MKITKIETIQIETPRYYGHISGHVLVKVHVDDGPVGWGEASDSKADDLGGIAKGYAVDRAMEFWRIVGSPVRWWTAAATWS